MERGIKISHSDFIKLIKYPDKYKKYNWLYLGSEFCDNLLDFYIKNLGIIKDLPNKICFLTPPLTDLKMPIFKKLILKLNNYENVKEISINDLSILNFKDITSKKLNIGRYLSKFFIKTHTNNINFNNTLQILKEYSIERIELTFIFSKIKKLHPKYSEINFFFTVYYPYFNLTTTMGCITEIEDIKATEDISLKKCNYNCINNAWEIKLKNEKLIIEGNTIFKKYIDNYKKIKNNIKKYNFYGLKTDRIIEIRY